MSELEVVAPKATLFVERSVQVRDYESLKVGMHYPVDLPMPVDSDAPGFGEYLTQVDAALKAGFVTLKGHIFDQLALEYEDKNGVLIEKVASHFKGAAEVVQSTPPPAARPVPQAAAPGPAGVFGACKGCGGVDFWDNRESKESGKYKSTAPDGKCKNKECSKGVWLKGR